MLGTKTNRFTLVKGLSNVQPEIGLGVYTLPDAAMILGLDRRSLYRWVAGYLSRQPKGLEIRRKPAGTIGAWGIGRDRGFNFNTLIELYTVAKLRERGVSMKVVRNARRELAARFEVTYPFALRGILTEGKKIWYQLDNPDSESILKLDNTGRMEFEKIIENFVKRIEFAEGTQLAERFWPDGRNSHVVVDPRRGFGRPIIDGTSITTETISGLIEAGERMDDLSALYDLEEEEIQDAHKFEQRRAA